MRLFAHLLLTVSLAIGALSAASAYTAPLSLPDDALVGLTLNAPAGVLTEDGVPALDKDGVPQPMFQKDHTLTAADVAALKAQRGESFEFAGRTRAVERVLVKEFAFQRWTGKWLFLLSLLGLAAGGWLIKSATRRDIAAAEATRADGQMPEAALDAVAGDINSLLRDLPGLPDEDARCEAIVETLGRAQREHIPVFVEARNLLISRMGLAAYAALMDRFAATERQINRAWSAAADEHYPEALTCLEKAHALMGETRGRLSM